MSGKYPLKVCKSFRIFVLVCLFTGGCIRILGRGEWVLHVEQIPLTDYRPLAQQFNPDAF